MSDDSILATYVTEIAGPEVAAPPPKFFQRLNRLSQLLGQYPIPEAGDACVLVMQPDYEPTWTSLWTTLAIRIGRSKSCDLRISHEGISGKHCQLFFDGEDWVVDDLGSTNGTRVNSHPISRPYFLCQGDCIELGPAMLIFANPKQPL